MARPSPQTDRVVALIEILAAQPDASVTLAEATRRLRVNKSTCHAMLTTLTEQAWLLRDPATKSYRLGPALVAIARVAAESFPLLDLAHPAMVDLSLEVGANCAAIGVSAEHVEVLDQIRDLRAAGEGLRVGASIPLRPPFGAAAIAWAAREVIERWLADAPAANRAHYGDALEVIRARGFVLEAAASSTTRLEDLLVLAGDDVTDAQRERAMFEPALLDRIARELATQDDYLVATIDPARDYTIVTMSAPVFDADGGVPLLLSLWGFPSRLKGDEIDRIGRRLATATAALSRSAQGATALIR